MNKNGEGAFLDIVFGIVGAVVGGLAFDRAPKTEPEQEKNRGPVAGGTWPQHFTIRLRYAGSWRQLRDRESPEYGLLSNKL